jgi:DNA-binding MarR family transcriptional regulator
MSKAQAPPLSAQLCFDLYAASRAMTSLYRPVLSELGLTYPQYLVLIVLWERDECTVKEIAEELRLDHGTLTPLLRRMELNGFVTRRRGDADERYVYVQLTPTGEALRSRAHQIQCDIKSVLGLDEAGFTALQATLRTLTSNILDG